MVGGAEGREEASAALAAMVGCPHGRGCRFAHGEGDMESTSLLKYKKRAEQKQKEE